MNFELWAVRVHKYKIFNMPQQGPLGVGVYHIIQYLVGISSFTMENFSAWVCSGGFGCLGIFTYKANEHCSVSTHSSDYVCIVFYELLWFQKAHVFLYIQLCILRKYIKIPSDFRPEWNIEYLTNNNPIFSYAVYLLWR